MEQKKLPQADLNRQRTTSFLMGLVLVLALIFVAFQLNISEGFGFSTDDLLSDDEQEAELAPLFKQEKQLVMLAPEEKKAPSQKLNIVEETPEIMPEELKPEEGNDGDDKSQTLEEFLEESEPIVPPEINPRDNPERFRVVEDLPQFPGGPIEFLKWLTLNLKYPPTMQQTKMEGKVVCQFIVNTDGSISDIRISKPVHPQFDREALRVLQLMPNWTPGIMDGKPCRTRVCIPIVFKL